MFSEDIHHVTRNQLLMFTGRFGGRGEGGGGQKAIELPPSFFRHFQDTFYQHVAQYLIFGNQQSVVLRDRSYPCHAKRPYLVYILVYILVFGINFDSFLAVDLEVY